MNLRSDHAQPGPRLVMSGWGLVSPLGHSAWETFAALLAGRMLAERAAALPADIAPVDLVRALGCVSLAQHTPSDPAVELAERAAREALFMAGAAAPGSPPPEAILGASKGAIDTLMRAAARHAGGRAALADSPALRSPPPADADLAAALGPHGYLAHHLAGRLGLGSVECVVAACASGLTALHVARRRLLDGDGGADRGDPHASGPPRRLLVVTAEASLLPLFIHSYDRLGVLPPLTADAYRGLPLDQRRAGFMLAELGAAVVLDRLDPGSEPAPGQIELLDTAVASEAHDVIRSAPEMPALRRVAERLLRGRPIAMLHPHATGTREQDAEELGVYAERLDAQPEPPHVYASKGALGHGLGAAGLVSLVLAALCAKARRRPPMPWLREPVETPLPLQPSPQPITPGAHAVFSAGFGGHVAGAVIAAAAPA